MKIPYIKIPIADVSAYLAPFDNETKGKIFQAVLDFGLYQKWTDLELPERGQIGYSNVQEIVENEIKNTRKFLKSQVQKAKKRWAQKQQHDEATALPSTVYNLCQDTAVIPTQPKNFSFKNSNTDDTAALPPRNNQTETEKEKENALEKRKEKDIKEKKKDTQKEKEKLTAAPAAGPVDLFAQKDPKTNSQPPSPGLWPPSPARGEGEKPTKPKRELNALQQFSNAVLENFEPHVQTPEQKRIWFKRNCRCLTDILTFCGENIPLALGAIETCVLRLQKANLSGGYEAVCRNLPEYMAQAQKDNLEANYASYQAS